MFAPDRPHDPYFNTRRENYGIDIEKKGKTLHVYRVSNYLPERKQRGAGILAPGQIPARLA